MWSFRSSEQEWRFGCLKTCKCFCFFIIFPGTNLHTHLWIRFTPEKQLITYLCRYLNYNVVLKSLFLGLCWFSIHPLVAVESVLFVGCHIHWDLNSNFCQSVVLSMLSEFDRHICFVHLLKYFNSLWSPGLNSFVLRIHNAWFLIQNPWEHHWLIFDHHIINAYFIMGVITLV